MQDTVIRIVIDPTAAQTGAARANAANNSIQASAAQLNRQMGLTQNGVTGVGSAAQIMARHFGQANGIVGNTTANIINMGNAAARAGQQVGAANNNIAQAPTLLDRLRIAAGGAAGAIGGLGVGFAGLSGMQLGGLAVAGAAIVGLGAKIASSIGQVQSFKASLTTVMDGDADAAAKKFDELAKFAAKTPFTLDQAVNGFIKLKALGLKPTEAAMTSYGNTSAAMGKSLEQMVEAVADATTGEFERLKEFGIKSSQTGNKVSFTFQGVTKTVAKNSDEIQKYLMAIGDVQFAGGMDRQAKTLGGAMAGLGDAVFLAFARMGDGAFANGLGNTINGLGVAITKLGPVFDAVGQGFGAMFSVINTAASGLATIFSPILNNLGAVVAAAKGAAVGFVALRAAMMLQGVAGAVGQVIAMERALGASGAASAIFSAGMKMAQAATNGLTVAIAANPVGAIVVGLTTAIALLYQFRDAINIGGGNLASLGDLGSAAFDAIGSGLSTLADGASSVLSSIGSGFSSLWADATAAMGPVWTGISSGFDTFKSAASSVLTSVDGFFGGAFSAIGAKVGGLFEGIDFSFAGFLRLSARTLDLVVGHFRGALGMVKTIWNNLPQAFSSIFTLAVNGAAAIIEKFFNNTIGAINTVLAFANKMGAGFGQIGTVELPRMDTSGAADLGKKLGAAYMGGFGNEVETGLDGLFNDANDKALQRKMGGLGKKKPVEDAVAKANPASDKKKKGKDEEAERLKRIAEFWKKQEDAIKLAGMLPLEAERYNKELELSNIYGEKWAKLSATDLQSIRDKIAAQQSELNTAKAITGMQEQTRKLSLENDLLDKRKLGLTEQQQAVEDALYQNRLAALDRHVDIASKEFGIAEAVLKKEHERNQAIKARGDLSKAALDTATKYSPRFDVSQQIKAIEAERVKFKTAFESGTLIDGQKISRTLYDSVMKGMDTAVSDIANTFHDQFIDRINTVANSFGGKIGSILQSVVGALSNMASAARGGQMGGVVGLLQTTLGNGPNGVKNAFGTAIDDGAKGFYAQVGTAFKDPLDSMSKGFKGFGDNIKAMFGKGGEFGKGLGNILGAAGQGAQIGDMTNSLMKGLGIKSSGTGAQLGGAVGGAAFGPIGSVVGSIAGGLIGGMLKKAKWGTSVVTGQNASGISTAGNSGSRKEYASGAASSIQDGLQGLADQFGTSVGNYLVSIGTYKDKWRVSTTGRDGKLKGGSGRTDIKDFGKDGQADAIEFALRNAISDGALTGLKAFTQRVLNDKNYSLDSAVSLATSYENALKELASIDDPVKYSVTSLLDPIDQLITKMRAAGASVSEVADIERLRSEKLKALTEQQLAGIKDFKDMLNGEGSGVTQLAQLTAKQTEFDSLKAQIASGKAVDQDVFTKLGQEIFGLSRDIYGTANSQFQSIRADLISVSDQFASVLTSQINSAAGIATTTAIAVDTSATDAAVQQQTAALTSALDTANSIAQTNGEKADETNRLLAALLASGLFNNTIGKIGTRVA